MRRSMRIWKNYLFSTSLGGQCDFYFILLKDVDFIKRYLNVREGLEELVKVRPNATWHSRLNGSSGVSQIQGIISVGGAWGLTALARML